MNDCISQLALSYIVLPLGVIFVILGLVLSIIKMIKLILDEIYF